MVYIICEMARSTGMCGNICLDLEARREELTFSVGIMLAACRPKVRRRTTGAALVE